MVSVPGFIVFAHGNDPGLLPPAELFGNWALAMTCLVLTAALAKSALRPVFEQVDGKSRSEVAAWTAISLAVLLAMGTWITRQSLVEALSPPPPVQEHAHSVYHGGQVVMWGDYHAEVARNVSGEYRIWLTDKYRRSISSEFFEATIYPRDAKTGKVDLDQAFPLDMSLDKDYRFSILDRDLKCIQVKLRYPGDYLFLDFDFDSPKGKKSLKDWCGI